MVKATLSSYWVNSQVILAEWVHRWQGIIWVMNHPQHRRESDVKVGVSLVRLYKVEQGCWDFCTYLVGLPCKSTIQTN